MRFTPRRPRLCGLLAVLCAAALVAPDPVRGAAPKAAQTAAPRVRKSPGAAPAVTDRGPAPTLLGELAGGVRVLAVPYGPKQWGLRVQGAGLASLSQPYPAAFEFQGAQGELSGAACGYASIVREGKEWLAKAELSRFNHLRFEVEDRWGVSGAVLRLSRTVTVSGETNHGFLSAITFALENAPRWGGVQWFAPGMIYGGFDHLPDAAIGGRTNYHAGNFTVRIREDRLPAPLFGALLPDSNSVAVLDARPNGATTREDSRDLEARSLVDARFQFGAIGAQERGGSLSLGYWFPGTEGEVTYRGDTYPGGQAHRWRRRYHPIRNGLVQRYEVAFRFGQKESYTNFCAQVWRWAWNTLQPRATPQDLEAVRRALINLLADQVVVRPERAGIPNYLEATNPGHLATDHKAVMGFTGKNLEAAAFLLREAESDTGARGERLRRLGHAIIDSFLRVKLSPPEGEGFSLEDGRAVCAIGTEQVYLRSFGDDLKALLKAYVRERGLGREHPSWLQWCRQFGDWLLTQQRPDGGFPRAWKPVTGEVTDPSPNSSFNAAPLLTLLTQATGEPRYLAAAIRAADFCGANGQATGRFVGGTIDNPDVLDKEAGTLSLEACLLLFEATKEKKWLDRAATAANYAETWIYGWNVPMPEDEDNTALHWKRGVSTIGLQLISTGHSLVDAYMAFDADEFATLSRYRQDPHYLEVARILLHNTKGMLALPGREYDLAGPGWQQEHWSLAPRRGFGLHRGWLPWVATSQLNGIFGLMDAGGDLYGRLAR